jgi:hypothetical protein
MKSGGSISIWFFIGISLLVNGVLILGAGIYELMHPLEHPVVLGNLHAGVWWGGILTLVGLFYCLCYAPGKGRA